MKSLGVVSGIISVITVMLLIYSSIDRKIEDKLNDPRFIRKVAEEVRLPFLIFDDKDNYSVSVDTGATEYIENIEIIKDKNKQISEIIVSPKKFMTVPPFLESIDDSNMGFEEPKRGKKYNWKYKTVRLASTLDSVFDAAIDHDSKLQRRFRLQLIVKPD